MPYKPDYNDPRLDAQIAKRASSHKTEADYLALAKFWAERKSKDPSTKCCAVIARPDNTIASIGFNGFPMGVPDDPELWADRDEKYPRVIHGELNAILLAREPLHGYTIYVWPGKCCAPCAGAIIQAGITRVIYPEREALGGHWATSQAIGIDMFNKAKIQHWPVDFDE